MQVKAVIRFMRPFTMITAFIAGAFLIAYYDMYYGVAINIYSLLCAGLALAFGQAFGQTINQCVKEEIEIDRINGKLRPTVTGELPLRNAKILAYTLGVTVQILAFVVSVYFAVVVFVMLIFAYTYTVPPVRMKKRFALNNLHQAIARGFLPWIAADVAVSGHISTMTVLVGFAVCTWVFGAQTSKDFGDVEGDKTFGILTFPVALGKEEARQLMISFMIFGIGLLMVFALYLLVPLYMIWLAIAVILPSYLIYRYVDKAGVTENNVAWMMYYITLGLYYLMPYLLIKFGGV